jgi:putative drug exporter of the RND superfamily
VLRRPALSLVLSAGLMIVLAIPVFGLHIGAAGVSTLPPKVDSKRGFVALQRNFGGSGQLNAARVVTARPNGEPELGRLRTLLSADPRFGPGRIKHFPDGVLAVLTVPVRGDPVGHDAVAALRDLRAHVIPSAFKDGAAPLVTGETAENVDYFDAVSNPAPYVLLVVLGLTLILLTVVFRSIVVAATAILLNLLSVGAAYGLLVLFFVHGIGARLFGFQQLDTIEAWVPLFLFSVLFGLSMDYQVFLLSRIRERYDQSGDTADAVSHGVASTARIITGAALIIVAVFSGFARGGVVMFQQMVFGIAVALLLDATVIRSVVLPSAMKLLARWNWYLPRWLEWLPRIDVENRASYRPLAAREL